MFLERESEREREREKKKKTLWHVAARESHPHHHEALYMQNMVTDAI